MFNKPYRHYNLRLETLGLTTAFSGPLMEKPSGPRCSVVTTGFDVVGIWVYDPLRQKLIQLIFGQGVFLSIVAHWLALFLGAGEAWGRLKVLSTR
jgi:hypothetical protein